MPSKTEILSSLPFRNEKDLIVYDQSTADIIQELLLTHKMYEIDYDNIYQFFQTGDVRDDCYEIWKFLKGAMPYQIEDDEEQTLKSPYMILQPSEKVDCKNYSLFIGGVLAAIIHHNGLDVDWCYRFAGYKKRAIEHVFVVVEPGTDDEVWVDPVLSSFDERLQPIYFKDKRI